MPRRAEKDDGRKVPARFCGRRHAYARQVQIEVHAAPPEAAHLFAPEPVAGQPEPDGERDPVASTESSQERAAARRTCGGFPRCTSWRPSCPSSGRCGSPTRGRVRSRVRSGCATCRRLGSRASPRRIPRSQLPRPCPAPCPSSLRCLHVHGPVLHVACVRRPFRKVYAHCTRPMYNMAWNVPCGMAEGCVSPPWT